MLAVFCNNNLFIFASQNGEVGEWLKPTVC